MKPHSSGFERGRRIVLVLVALAVLFGIIAFMFSGEDSKEQLLFISGAFLCILGAAITAFMLCRCPHCGKRILNGVLVLKVCPNCKHSLTTGSKVKHR